MSTKTQQVCAYTGYAMLALFLIGFAVSGFLSPPSPEASAEEIARMFDDDRFAIRIGLIVSMFAAALLIPWGAGLFIQLRRSTGRHSPLPHVVSLSTAVFSLEFIYLIMFWQVAAFREDLSPEIVRMLNDLAWVPFVGLSSTAVVMALAMGWAILCDHRSTPVFPRWSGYFNIWAATLFTPGTLCVFFHDGPFAYNGVLSWYLPVTVFTIWMITNTVLLLRAIRSQQEEAVSATAGAAAGSNGASLEVEDLARELAALRLEMAKSFA